jgi:hypothetical protein
VSENRQHYDESLQLYRSILVYLAETIEEAASKLKLKSNHRLLLRNAIDEWIDPRNNENINHERIFLNALEAVKEGWGEEALIDVLEGDEDAISKYHEASKMIIRRRIHEIYQEDGSSPLALAQCTNYARAVKQHTLAAYFMIRAKKTAEAIEYAKKHVRPWEEIVHFSLIAYYDIMPLEKPDYFTDQIDPLLDHDKLLTSIRDLMNSLSHCTPKELSQAFLNENQISLLEQIFDLCRLHFTVLVANFMIRFLVPIVRRTDEICELIDKHIPQTHARTCLLKEIPDEDKLTVIELGFASLRREPGLYPELTLWLMQKVIEADDPESTQAAITFMIKRATIKDTGTLRALGRLTENPDHRFIFFVHAFVLDVIPAWSLRSLTIPNTVLDWTLSIVETTKDMSYMDSLMQVILACISSEPHIDAPKVAPITLEKLKADIKPFNQARFLENLKHVLPQFCEKLSTRGELARYLLTLGQHTISIVKKLNAPEQQTAKLYLSRKDADRFTKHNCADCIMLRRFLRSSIESFVSKKVNDRRHITKIVSKINASTAFLGFLQITGNNNRVTLTKSPDVMKRLNELAYMEKVRQFDAAISLVPPTIVTASALLETQNLTEDEEIEVSQVFDDMLVCEQFMNSPVAAAVLC